MSQGGQGIKRKEELTIRRCIHTEIRRGQALEVRHGERKSEVR